jgi:hypothetical protein
MLLLFPLFYGFSAGEHGSPERNRPYYDKYRILKQNEYVDLGHGLFESSWLGFDPDHTYLYYNEYYNNAVQVQNRHNENIALIFTGRREKIEHLGTVKIEDVAFQDNTATVTISDDYREQYGEPKTFRTVALSFDEHTHRLISMRSALPFWHDFQSGNCNEYSFEYNDDGKIDSFYAVYDWGRILRKKYYYDGFPRRLYRPYFIGEDTTGLEEIVAYDGAVLKYITKLYSGKRGVARLSMEYAEKNHHFTVSEYDENLKIIRIVAYYEGSDLYAPRDEPVETLYLKDGYSDVPIEFDN